MGENPGLVIRAQSHKFIVRAKGGEFPAILPKKLRYRSPDLVDPVAVGDRVLLDLSADRAVIEIPGRFTEMLQEAPDLAMAWRLATRELFASCLGRGLRVTEFFRDPATGGGRYLLERTPPQDS